MKDSLKDLRTALSDRYRVERELGRGGMATVYLAQDLKHHRAVAIKVLHAELAAVLGAERFLREIEIAAGLNHPHVLPVYDSGEAGGFLFYVMPFVEGESLRERLNRERQLPIEDALRIAREVADALGYAHGRDVVHRDIKPENILLESGHAVVADFGIARAISAAGGDKLTETGLALGTPTYMSPEQAAADPEVDGRSDLYSLACVTYEMIVGAPPFTGATVPSLLHQHMTAEPPSATAVRPTVSAQIDRVLRRALSKTPADRFGTSPEFARALETPTAARTVDPSSTEFRKPSRAWHAALAVLVVLGALGGYVVLKPNGARDGLDKVPRLVVLPFENLGAGEDDYFADGITDEVTARLTGLSGLAVIARQSALQYEGTDKTPQQIGSELDAEYILEATISWQQTSDGVNRVRVRPQLIRASDATQVWASVYDEDMTEVFAVQTNIAEQVVSALGVALIEPEVEALADRPTSNTEAYDLYLQAREHRTRWTQSGEEVITAIRLYERAVALDSGFAHAFAGLGRAHQAMYWMAYDRTEARMSEAKRAIDQAAKLRPDIVEVHWARALYHYARFEYEDALRELGIVQDRQPHNGDVAAWIGYVKRRQGKFDEAISYLERAKDLDLRSEDILNGVAETHMLLRNYGEASRNFDNVVVLRPGYSRPHMWTIHLATVIDGDIAGARLALAAAERAGFGSDQLVVYRAVLLEMLDRAYQAGIRRIRAASLIDAFQDQFWFVPRERLLAENFLRAGIQDSARHFFEAAVAILEPLARDHPEDPRYHSSLGITYAGLGRKEDAVRLARQGVDILPISKEAFRGLFAVEALAQVYAMVGEYDAATTELERLLSVPSHLSVPLLRIDPRWDPLREHPRFRQLVADEG